MSTHIADRFEEALFKGETAHAVELLKSDGRYAIESAMERDYGSLLHAAAHFKNQAVLALALTACDLEKRDSSDMTAFHVAAGAGAVECLKLLKAAGANCSACYEEAEECDADILQLAMPPDGNPDTFRWALNEGLIDLTDYYQDDMDVREYILDYADRAWVDAVRDYIATTVPAPTTRSRQMKQGL